MVQASLFLETLQEDVDSDTRLRTNKEVYMSRALQALRLGNRHTPGAFHQILCKLYTYLVANDMFDDVSELNPDEMPEGMRSPASRAESRRAAGRSSG